MSLVISPTGKNLNILINCQYCRHHDWMAFVSWYSIYKNLPDSRVKLCLKDKDLGEVLFAWPQKCDLEVIKQIPDNYFIIEPHVMAVSTYDPESIGPIDAKKDEIATFVSYLNGCGKFVLSDWINSIRSPFVMADRFYSDNLTLNEYRILKIWEKCRMAFNALKE